MAHDERPTLRFLGGTGTVTGSRFLLESNGARILIDCGLFQGYKQLRLRNRAPFPVPPSSIDAVVLTHAHLDHSGYLPALVRAGFSGPIICSAGTAALVGLLWPDSAHLLEEEARFAARKGFSKHASPAPLYTTADAERALESVSVRRFGETIGLPGRVEAELHHAGHILGAAHVRLRAIFGREIPIAAEVVQLESMSAHADAEQILDWMRGAHVDRAYVVHGEPDAADVLRGRIERELGVRARVPEQGEQVEV